MIEIDKRLLVDFLSFIARHPTPLAELECRGTGKDFWTSDLWVIEVAKCLYLGEEGYLEDPPPRRLEGNQNYNPARIIDDVERKLSMASHLEEFKMEVDSLLVCEVGRGLDILVSVMVADWKVIYCYDHHSCYGDFLRQFFPEHRIEFTTSPSHGYDLNSIKEKVVMVADHPRFGADRAAAFFCCENILHIIRDGDVVGNLTEWR